MISSAALAEFLLEAAIAVVTVIGGTPDGQELAV